MWPLAISWLLVVNTILKKHLLRDVSLVLNSLFSRQATFPELTSIIAARELNFSVRNGKRCDPSAKSGEQKIQSTEEIVATLTTESNT